MIEPVSDDFTIAIKPRLRRKRTDDDLGRVSQRGVEQPPDGGPEVFRQGSVASPIKPASGTIARAEAGKDQHRARLEPVENDRDRNERKQPVQTHGNTLLMPGQEFSTVAACASTRAFGPETLVHRIAGDDGGKVINLDSGDCPASPVRARLKRRAGKHGATAVPRCSIKIRLISFVTSGDSWTSGPPRRSSRIPRLADASWNTEPRRLNRDPGPAKG